MSAQVESAIRSHLAANWNTAVARIREPNTTFNPQGPDQDSGPLCWIELRFPGASIVRGDIGAVDAPLWEEHGAFMVDVYSPTTIGTSTASAIADLVWDLFSNRQLEGVQIEDRLQGQAGERTVPGIDGIFWGISYGIGYRYQSVTVI